MLRHEDERSNTQRGRRKLDSELKTEALGIRESTASGCMPHFVQPASFEPREFLLTTKLQRYLQDARWLVSTIMQKLARGEGNRDGYVRLHAAYLMKIMNQRNYAGVIEELLLGEAIVRCPYRKGLSFGYRLSDRFAADPHVRVPVTDKGLIAKLEAFRSQQNESRKSRMLPVHHKLAELQRRLQIDGDPAREILAAMPDRKNRFATQGILISDIELGQFRMSVGRYGRVSNNITNLSRKLRPQLHVDGERLASVDLSCAQPAFTGKRCKEIMSKGSHNATEGHNGRDPTSIYDLHETFLSRNDSLEPGSDVVKYCQLVQAGRFYDFMMAVLSGHRITRDQMKKRFLADVIAKRKANPRGDEYSSHVENAFREQFPTVYAFIREENRHGWEHANLIRTLQRDESQFVIEMVAADLVARHPTMFIITLHDAIYTTPQNLRDVEKAFERGFERTGFRMLLKIES